jgi:hypothetical protein
MSDETEQVPQSNGEPTPPTPDQDNTRFVSVDPNNPTSLRDALINAQSQLEPKDKLPTANFSQAAPTRDDDDDDDKTRDLSVSQDDIQTSELPKRDYETGDKAPRKLGEKVERDVRKALRRVQDHLINAQVGLGAQHQVVDLTEVIYHPHNTVSSLNYVTPRRRTAWISADQIEHGLDHLRAQGRTARLQYIEGLYPPMFARNLGQLNLAVEQETPLMIYEHPQGEPAPPPMLGEDNDHMRLVTVQDVRGMEVWWYVWRNAHYEVFTLGVEPLFVGRDMAAVALGHQIDIIAYQGNFPFGVARVTLHQDTAHIVSIAVFHELETPQVLKRIISEAMRVALERGCNLLFMPGITATDRDVSRKLGFVDFGSIVCYAAKAEPTQPQVSAHDTMEHPILDIKSQIIESK